MNLESTYRVNVEQTVRKIGEAEDASIQRMLRHYVGDSVSKIPQNPKREAKIQQMIADYQKDELATTMRLEITADHATIRSTDGDGTYPIKRRTVAADGKVSLIVGIPDDGEELQWDITIIDDRILVFSGENEMADLVWERV